MLMQYVDSRGSLSLCSIRRSQGEGSRSFVIVFLSLSQCISVDSAYFLCSFCIVVASLWCCRTCNSNLVSRVSYFLQQIHQSLCSSECTRSWRAKKCRFVELHFRKSLSPVSFTNFRSIQYGSSHWSSRYVRAPTRVVLRRETVRKGVGRFPVCGICMDSSENGSEEGGDGY